MLYPVEGSQARSGYGVVIEMKIDYLYLIFLKGFVKLMIFIFRHKSRSKALRKVRQWDDGNGMLVCQLAVCKSIIETWLETKKIQYFHLQ